MSELATFSIIENLSKTDSEILTCSQLKADILGKRKSLEFELSNLGAEIRTLELSLAQLNQRQTFEEERLKAEQKRIVDRRKHLSTLSGTKGAKLVEREVDIASRNIESLEEKALEVLAESERVGAALREKVEVFNLKKGTLTQLLSEEEALISDITARLQLLNEKRVKHFEECTPEIRALYTRVLNKYPGGAVAKAVDGACQGCFRSLPAQIFNQVQSGKVLTCPDCSRMLIIPSTDS